MEKHEMKTCSSCKETSMHEVKRTNHIMHIILSILTGGLWLIVYLFAASWDNKKYSKCPLCNVAEIGNDKNINRPGLIILLLIGFVLFVIPTAIYLTGPTEEQQEQRAREARNNLLD